MSNAVSNAELRRRGEAIPDGQRYWYQCYYCDRVYASPAVVAKPYCGGCPEDDEAPATEWMLPIGGKVYTGTGPIPDDLFWRWMKDVPPAERGRE